MDVWEDAFLRALEGSAGSERPGHTDEIVGRAKRIATSAAAAVKNRQDKTPEPGALIKGVTIAVRKTDAGFNGGWCRHWVREFIEKLDAEGLEIVYK